MFNTNAKKMLKADMCSLGNLPGEDGNAYLDKYTVNCMLATKVSLMSEMTNLAERLGAGIAMVRKEIGSDSLISYHFFILVRVLAAPISLKMFGLLFSYQKALPLMQKMFKAVEDRNQLQIDTFFENSDTIFNGVKLFDCSGMVVSVNKCFGMGSK